MKDAGLGMGGQETSACWCTSEKGSRDDWSKGIKAGEGSKRGQQSGYLAAFQHIDSAY